MNIEIQTWPYIHVNTNYTVRFVGYRIITRSVTGNLRIAITATYEFLPPTGLVNSEGLNLFIGNSI